MIGGASGIGFGLGISIGNNNNGFSKSKPKDILFNPKINSNIELKYIKFYRTNELGVTELNRRINIGDRIDPNSLEYPGKISMVISFIGKFNDAIIPNLIVNGEIKEMFDGNGAYAGLDDGYDHAYALIPFVADLSIDLTVDEYIRFEDIVQPYPYFIMFIGSDGYNYSWGSKLKVGEEYYIGNQYLLYEELYDINYDNFGIKCNGESVVDNKITVSKKMILSLNEKPTWNLGFNSPKCILFQKDIEIAPPAESLIYLGYIPDISGNGNHGYLHNFDLDTQLDEYGVLHFDGVDDYIDFPTMPEGGKQVFMKCNTSNWGSSRMLYDQRASNNTDKFGIFIGPGSTIAYNGKNSGYTYIDGVLNKYITPLDLAHVTHNITAINRLVGPNNETTTPVIGADYTHNNYFANMKLHSFMLFDEISDNEAIVKLNEAIGIESNYVEAPPYYYDTFGKTNEDADKAVIANKGFATGDYDLQVKNVAYKGESGYNNNVSFNDPMWWDRTVDTSFSSYWLEIKEYNIIGAADKFGYPIWGILLTPRDQPKPSDVPPFTIRIENIVTNLKIVYLYVQEDGSTNTYEMLADGIYTLPASYNSKYVKNPNDLQDARMGFFAISDTVRDGNVLTIKILNGLLLDGVDDYIANANIPVFTDYTYIFKRDILESAISSASMRKGNKWQAAGGAFIADFGSSESTQGFYSFGGSNSLTGIPQTGTIYGTKTSVNGKPVNVGTNTDIEGLDIGRWDSFKKMAFQKLMLYPVTIDSLSINMLRNLFEFDGEIDMRSPIFKPYKGYSSIPDFSQFTLRDGITANLLPTTIEITNIKGLGPSYMEIKQPLNFLFKPFTVNVEGITNDVTLYYIYSDNNMIVDVELLNGNNEISYHPDGYTPIGFAVTCYEENLDCNITITLIN